MMHPNNCLVACDEESCTCTPKRHELIANLKTAKPPGNACLYDPDDVAFPKGFMPIDHPTPVQGEALLSASEENKQDTVAAQGIAGDLLSEALPVVAWRINTGHGSSVKEWVPEELQLIWKPLTDHAQATAEIAQRDAVNSAQASCICRLIDDVKAKKTELTTLRTQLSDATGQVGKLREALKPFSDAFEATGIQSYRAVGAEFVEFMDRNTITPAGPLMADFRKAWETMSGMRAIDAALNSTAQESADQWAGIKERCQHGVRWENRCGSCDKSQKDQQADKEVDND